MHILEVTVMSRKYVLFCGFSIVIFLSSLGTSLAYGEQGYLYLSPVPNAQYVSPFLVRFTDIRPADLSNLHSFIVRF